MTPHHLLGGLKGRDSLAMIRTPHPYRTPSGRILSRDTGPRAVPWAEGWQAVGPLRGDVDGVTDREKEIQKGQKELEGLIG